jgi:hypothetical protein
VRILVVSEGQQNDQKRTLCVISLLRRGEGVVVNLFTVEEVQDLCRLKPSGIPDICISIQLKMRKRLIDLLWHLKRMKNCRIYC